MITQKVKLVSIRCRVKPKSPQEVGYTCVEPLREAMKRQAALPLSERIRPCHKNGWWWVEQAPGCMKCMDAIWVLDVDEKEIEATPLTIKEKVVEIAVKETGEVMRYKTGGRREMGTGFII